MLTRLPLRVKSPPRETYMVAPHLPFMVVQLKTYKYEVYVSKKRKQEFPIKTLEELLSKPIDSYTTTQGSLPTTTTRRSANSSQDLSSLNSRFANFNLGESSCQTTVHVQEQTTSIPKSASQADTRATIPLGEQVNPLDESINNNDRWPASDYELPWQHTDYI